MEPRSDVIEFAEHSARNSFVLFIGDFSSAAVLAVSSIVVARLLGPEGYGIYSVSFVVPALVISLASLGLDSAAIRFPTKYISEGKNKLALRFIRMVLAFRLFTGLAASFACFIVSDIMAETLLDRLSVAPYIRLLSMLVLFETFFSLLYGLFVGLNSSRDASMTRILMAIFKGITAPILVLLGLGVYGALIGHMVGYIIPSIIGLLVLYFHHYRRLNSPSGIEEFGGDHSGSGCFWETVKFSLPLYGSSLLILLLGNYQAILLAKFSSDVEIGCFRAAVNISTILTVVVSPILTALFPAFSRLNSHGLREKIEEFLNLSVKYSSLIVVPLAALIASISNHLVNVVYGENYAPAGVYLAFYSVTHMLIGLGSGIFGSLFNGVGETGLTLRLNIINLAVFVTIAPFLAAPYGVLGVIASLLTSNLISTLYAYELARRRLDLSLNLSVSAKIYASSALSAAPAVVLAFYTYLPSIISLILCSAIYAATYLTVAPTLKAINREDLNELERIFGVVRPLKPIFRLIARYENKVLGWCSS
ncbi:MAG: flippase [Candidatus Bathyarchaeia archaeon]